MNTIVQQKNFMNTVITIKVVKNDHKTVKILDCIELAFLEFDRIVKKYSRFDDNSELSNLNRSKGEWVNLSDEFLYLIEYMLKMAAETDGAFDPTVIDFLELYGYDKNYDFSKLEKPELDSLVKKIAKERDSWKEIELDKINNLIKLKPNQRIDLGGIGKGYAIDCAYNKLNELGDFLIDAGGDIRAKGLNDKKELWKVDLLTQTQGGEKKVVGAIELNNESISSSGSWARRFKSFHHLINPKTGLPQNTFSTVFVQAPTAIESDTWATALFVAGEDLAKKMPENFKYFVIKN